MENIDKNKNEMFKKYKGRLIFEGIIKSLVIALIAGFVAATVFAIVAVSTNSFAGVLPQRFFEAGASISAGILMLIIGVGVLVSTTIAATPFFFFFIFKPNISNIAFRVDRLGLEERVITMLEFEGDNSYMANVQREDAKINLTKASPKTLKIAAFMLIPVIIASALAVVFTSTIIATALTVEPPMAWTEYGGGNRHIATDPGPDEEFRYVEFEAFVFMGAGHIDGDVFQVIIQGENGRAIVAVPARGWAFVTWVTDVPDADPDNRLVQVINAGRYFDDDWEGFWMYIAAAEFQDGEEDGDEPNPDDNPVERPDDGEDENESDPDAIREGNTNVTDPDNSNFDQEFLDRIIADAMARLAAGEELDVATRTLLEMIFGGLAR